jgi:segregation and condensation protein B
MSEISPTIQNVQQRAVLEALLFVAAGPVSINQLADATGIKIAGIESALNELQQQYQTGSGLRIQRHGGRIQLTSAPEYAEYVEKFLGLEASAHLSRAAQEALAIIAYRQPITRPGIDAIRGVSSDGVLRSLLSKGLIQEIGRTEGPGRPILFGTTSEFLQYFGLSSLAELPSYETAEEEKDETETDTRLLKD